MPSGRRSGARRVFGSSVTTDTRVPASRSAGGSRTTRSPACQARSDLDEAVRRRRRPSSRSAATRGRRRPTAQASSRPPRATIARRGHEEPRRGRARRGAGARRFRPPARRREAGPRAPCAAAWRGRRRRRSPRRGPSDVRPPSSTLDCVARRRAARPPPLPERPRRGGPCADASRTSGPARGREIAGRDHLLDDDGVERRDQDRLARGRSRARADSASRGGDGRPPRRPPPGARARARRGPRRRAPRAVSKRARFWLRQLERRARRRDAPRGRSPSGAVGLALPRGARAPRRRAPSRPGTARTSATGAASRLASTGLDPADDGPVDFDRRPPRRAARPSPSSSCALGRLGRAAPASSRSRRGERRERASDPRIRFMAPSSPSGGKPEGQPQIRLRDDHASAAAPTRPCARGARRRAPRADRRAARPLPRSAPAGSRAPRRAAASASLERCEPGRRRDELGPRRGRSRFAPRGRASASGRLAPTSAAARASATRASIAPEAKSGTRTAAEDGPGVPVPAARRGRVDLVPARDDQRRPARGGGGPLRLRARRRRRAPPPRHRPVRKTRPGGRGSGCGSGASGRAAASLPITAARAARASIAVGADRPASSARTSASAARARAGSAAVVTPSSDSAPAIAEVLLRVRFPLARGSPPRPRPGAPPRRPRSPRRPPRHGRGPQTRSAASADRSAARAPAARRAENVGGPRGGRPNRSSPSCRRIVRIGGEELLRGEALLLEQQRKGRHRIVRREKAGVREEGGAQLRPCRSLPRPGPVARRPRLLHGRGARRRGPPPRAASAAPEDPAPETVAEAATIRANSISTCFVHLMSASASRCEPHPRHRIRAGISQARRTGAAKRRLKSVRRASAATTVGSQTRRRRARRARSSHP